MTSISRSLMSLSAASRTFIGQRLRSSKLLICIATFALLTGCGEPNDIAISPTPVRVAGRVVERLVDTGERVTQGQALARLDATSFQLAAREAATDLAQAQATLARMQRDVEHNRPLAESGVIAGAAFDALQTQQAQLQEQVQAAQSRLARARNDLIYATLTVPTSGTIALMQADVGQVVAAGTPVLRLARGGEHEIEVNVPESRIGQMASGQGASFEPARDDDRDVGAWEYVVHQLAQQAGIIGPPAKLVKLNNEFHTFCVQRFDRTGTVRRFYASAMTLLRKTHSEGTSYLELAQFIRSQGDAECADADLEQLFRRVAFNVAVGKRDDHLRNHGFILGKTGWRVGSGV